MSTAAPSAAPRGTASRVAACVASSWLRRRRRGGVWGRCRRLRSCLWGGIAVSWSACSCTVFAGVRGTYHLQPREWASSLLLLLLLPGARDCCRCGRACWHACRRLKLIRSRRPLEVKLRVLRVRGEEVVEFVDSRGCRAVVVDVTLFCGWGATVVKPLTHSLELHEPHSRFI